MSGLGDMPPVGPSRGAIPSGSTSSSSSGAPPGSSSAAPTGSSPAAPPGGPTGGQMGGAGEWMAHVKKTMRANPGKKLKEILKLAKKTYKKGTKKTARKTRKGSRKSKSWFMGGSGGTIVAAGYTPGAPMTGSSRHRVRKH